MITVCWAAKGGSGTTVVAASMALAASQPTLLVDLAGDIPATLGLPEPAGPGVREWLRSDAPPARLRGLEVSARAGVDILPTGRAGPDVEPVESQRRRELAAWLADQSRHVIVDGGSATSPPAELLDVADHVLLVTRPCYLALRAAIRTSVRPTGVVLVAEPGRALAADDVAASLGAPVVATLLLDPAVARAVDAGLLASRLPAGFRRAVQLAA